MYGNRLQAEVRKCPNNKTVWGIPCKECLKTNSHSYKYVQGP